MQCKSVLLLYFFSNNVILKFIISLLIIFPLLWFFFYINIIHSKTFVLWKYSSIAIIYRKINK